MCMSVNDLSRRSPRFQLDIVYRFMNKPPFLLHPSFQPDSWGPGENRLCRVKSASPGEIEGWAPEKRLTAGRQMG